MSERLDPLPLRALLACRSASSADLARMALLSLGFAVIEAQARDEMLEHWATDGDSLALVVTDRSVTGGDIGVPVVQLTQAPAAPGSARVCVSEPEFSARLADEIRLLVRLNGMAHTDAAADDNGEAVDVIDQARLQQFTGGRDEVARELSSLFLASGSDYLVRLAGQLHDRAAWRETVHGLKGAAGNFGATRLARSAALAESCGPDRRLLEELRQEFARLERVLAPDFRRDSGAAPL